MTRLRTKFSEFQSNREILSSILDDYTADYRQTDGTMLQRQELLQERYSRRAPKFSHLIWSDEDSSEYWTAADIAIVLGRDKSSVTRTLAKMERSEGWCSKLLALRHSAKAANGLTVNSYGREIFSLIIDHYEEEYLQRFSQPRHGTAQDINEIKRFWLYMKQCEETERLSIAAKPDTEEFELPEIPPMNWNDIFSLIWRRVFTVRTGTFFTVIFAVCFEVAGRWAFVKPIFMAGAVGILASSAVLIRLRKWRADVLADIGAGALLFTVLWTAGISAGVGEVQHHSPTGRDFLLQEASGWVEVYRINDEVFVAVMPILYSDLSKDVEALVYGINSQPDKVIPRGELSDYYEQILSTRENNIEYVTSQLIFTDKTRSDIRKSTLSR